MIDMKKFYIIASVLMFIAFLGNLWNLINIWNTITMGAKISQIAGSLFFNLLLAIVFMGLWKITPGMTAEAGTITSPDLDAMLKKYQDAETAQKDTIVPEKTKPARTRVKKPLHL